ncbi:MAG: hypothetical protein LBC56_07095 [Oscillospiraceae bacterium]|nr:hypothetical protein [Oscillospiraceae bacterium]
MIRLHIALRVREALERLLVDVAGVHPQEIQRLRFLHQVVNRAEQIDSQHDNYSIIFLSRSSLK